MCDFLAGHAMVENDGGAYIPFTMLNLLCQFIILFTCPIAVFP